MLRKLFVLAVLLFVSLPAWANLDDDTISFGFILIMYEPTIYAPVEIDNDVFSCFIAFVAVNKVPDRTLVYLNSPLGSVVDAMRAGQLFQERKFGVDTANILPDHGHTSGPPLDMNDDHIQPGRCISACTILYFGGLFRYSLQKDSEYGVHRSFDSSGKMKYPMDAAQMLSADLAIYINKRGADPQLQQIMSRYGGDSNGHNQYATLSRDLMKKSRVANNGNVPNTPWSMNSRGRPIRIA